MELERASLFDLEHRYKRVLAASTQFADTRVFAPGEDARDILLIELKTQLLFDDALILRDADIVNSSEVLGLALQDSGFQSLLRSGVCVVGLREKADCLTEVNDLASSRRADPRRHEGHRVLIAGLDRFLCENHISTVQIDALPARDVFSELIQRVLSCLESNPSEHEILSKAVDFAEKRRNTKHPCLRFGEIYFRIWGQTPPQRVKHHKELLEWCHTAHALTVPSQLKTPISSAVKDLTPDKVQAVLQLSPTITSVDAKEVIDLYPEYVPTETWLRHESFAAIMEHRRIGEEEGYFGALARLRSTPHGERLAFDQACADYFTALSNYVAKLKLEDNGEIQGDWTLKKWKRDAVEKLSRKRRAKDEAVDAMVMAVPIVALGGAMMHVFPLPPDVYLFDIGVPTAKLLEALTMVALAGGMRYRNGLRENPYETMLGSAQISAAR